MSEHVSYSGAWLAEKDDVELEALLSGAMAGSPAFAALHTEIQRREAAKSGRQQMRWIKAAFWVSVLGIVVTIAVAWFD